MTTLDKETDVPTDHLPSFDDEDLTAVIDKAIRAADGLGVDLGAVHQRLGDIVAGELPAAGSSASAPSVTLREFVSQAETALRSQPGETLRTYASAWRLLADGIRLVDHLPGGDRPWDEDRERAWLAHAAAADTERELGIGLATDPARYERDADGALVVWPGYGHLRPDEVTSTRFITATSWARLRASTEAHRRDEIRRKEGQAPCGWTGDGAVETLITATRGLYRLAAGDGLVKEGFDPTTSVTKPKRSEGSRGPLTPTRLADVAMTMTTTGNDPELDGMLLSYHLLTGARQEGAWRLQLRHLHDDTQAIAIPDKGSKTKRGGYALADLVPVPASLLLDLRAFAASRGSHLPTDPVFRYRGRNRQQQAYPPLTRRRYNTIYKRIRTQHEWAAADGFGVHTLRHHAAAKLEAIGGRPVKMRFLRHTPNGQTDGYGRADFSHLAWAIATWTGEPHPHAVRPPWLDEDHGPASLSSLVQ